MEGEKVRETANEETNQVEKVDHRLEPTGMEAVTSKDQDDKEEETGEDETEIQPESALHINTKQLTDKDRLILYEKAVRLKRKGNNRHALQCFLCCLQGLKEQTHFSVLAECLHHIAEIYSTEEDYKTAIQFAQAEKLYYETALITVNKDEKPESSEENSPSVINDHNENSTNSQIENPTSATSEEAQKADEYEKLAHMCLKQKDPQLALDYCAKAVKLQQACYGEQHPITLQTLDLFTVIYAEMGKLQYKAAMEAFTAAQEKEKQAKQLQNQEVKDNKENKPDHVTGQHDDNESGSVDVFEKMHDKQNQPDSNQDTTEDTIQVTVTSSCALVVYFIITIILASALTAILCYFTQTDIQTTYNYAITRTKFYYYYYFVQTQTDGYKYY